jgi:hypothetical protein
VARVGVPRRTFQSGFMCSPTGSCFSGSFAGSRFGVNRTLTLTISPHGSMNWWPPAISSAPTRVTQPGPSSAETTAKRAVSSTASVK